MLLLHYSCVLEVTCSHTYYMLMIVLESLRDFPENVVL
jgi:hypothetical protein